MKEEAAPSLNVRGLLKSAESLPVAEEHVLDAIKVKLAGLLMTSLDDIDSSRPRSHHGLNSLVAVIIFVPYREYYIPNLV